MTLLTIRAVVNNFVDLRLASRAGNFSSNLSELTQLFD